MNIEVKFAGLEVGYDVPAIPGMSKDEIQTPGFPRAILNRLRHHLA